MSISSFISKHPDDVMVEVLFLSLCRLPLNLNQELVGKLLALMMARHTTIMKRHDSPRGTLRKL
jgi:hypothetical protein